MSPAAGYPTGPLTLAELIDLEVRLLDDRTRDPDDIARRDARVAESLAPNVGALPRPALVRAWLGAVTPAGELSTGARVSAFYRLLGWVLPITFFVMGAGTAAGLLVYDGRDPVNIMNYLVVLVGLQIVLIVLTSIAMLPSAWLRGFVRLFGFERGAGLSGFLRELALRSAGVVSRHVAVGERGRAALGRLSAWQTIYGGVERWLLTALTQRAAAAFNVGAIAATMYIVTVRALAFAWSTTLEVDPGAMATVFRALATPWRWLPAAVPTRELVAASRYFPGRAYDPDLLGDWWPFLVASVVAYGLVPRLVLLAYAAQRARAARKSLQLDHGECAALVERLTRGASLWGKGAAIGGAVTAGPQIEVPPACVLPASGTEVRALRWADAALAREDVERLVGAKLGWRVVSLDDVRGGDDAEERARVGRLAGNGAPVLVVAEAFEPPSKGLQRLLRGVREAVGSHVPVVVALCGEAGDHAVRLDDVRIWRQRVAALGDPWLRVEALGS
jgi:hypothetical protein